LPDPDPFQPNVNYTFPDYFNTVQIGNYDTYDDDEKNKTVTTRTVVNKSKKNDSYFPTCVKLGLGSVFGFGIKMEIWIVIRIGIKTMPIHNTAANFPRPPPKSDSQLIHFRPWQPYL
jgi:hypothetical protein